MASPTSSTVSSAYQQQQQQKPPAVCHRSVPSVAAQQYQRQRSDELERARSMRRQKYKARMEKAKREFLENRGSVSDVLKSREDLAKKFKVSSEQMDKCLRQLEPARGPYLEHLSRSGNLHISVKQEPANYVPPKSKYDKLHREMVDRAERMWANYQKRKMDSRLNLYARTRGFSTGFLEAAVDGDDDAFSGTRSPERYFTTDETDLDDVHQRNNDDAINESRRRASISSKERQSQDHLRARSADFLLSRANREQAEPPENQLRRVMGDHREKYDEDDDEEEELDVKLSEHELRFRKSMEKLHLPDWYLQSKYAGEKLDASPASRGRPDLTERCARERGRDEESMRKPPAPVLPDINRTRVGQPWTYLPGPRRPKTYSSMRERRRPDVAAFDIPVDFFDRYKGEIEQLRKSRSELHGGGAARTVAGDRQLPPAPLKPTFVKPPAVGAAVPPLAVPVAAVRPTTKLEYTETYTVQKRIISTNSRSSAFSAVTKEQRQVGEPPSTIARRPRQLGPGYSISAPPPSWNVPKRRDSIVVDVLESAVGPASGDRSDTGGEAGFSNLTLEEAMDAILSLADAPRHLNSLDETLGSKDAPKIRPLTPNSFYRPAVYVDNDRLMERCARAPNLCRKLLQYETIWVRCNCCGRTEDASTAKGRYVSCRHCYTYYCSYGCRSDDWSEHKFACTYSRVNTVCKEVIIRVKNDLTTQRHMSLVARRGYASRGRGSVNMRFLQLETANRYIAQGWPAIADDSRCLSYLTISDLVEMGKSADLVVTCRQYSPTEKFILSVSVLVEIDAVPKTPLFCSDDACFRFPRKSYDGAQVQSRTVARLGQSLPPARRCRQLPPVVERQASASSILKNVLKSLENIAPGDVASLPSKSTDSHFDRANRIRHTVDSGQRFARRDRPRWAPSGQTLTLGNGVDETEV